MKVSDEEQFAAVVNRQARLVYRVAYSLLRNSQDSEDVVQETFLKIYRTGAWRRMEKERAFLARTAWRIALDRMPKRTEELGAFRGTGDDPEAAAIGADKHAMVRRYMDSLPEELRQPLELSTVDEMTSPEIAIVMGIPEGTVRTRISRAKRLLKDKLEFLWKTTNSINC